MVEEQIVDSDKKQIEDDIAGLLDDMKSLILATVHEDKTPLASYTPFATTDNDSGLWILVSDLAGHAQNLSRSGLCSCLLIRDEQDSAQVYVRERLQYEMKSVEYPRDQPEWESGIRVLRDRQGALVDTLTSLADFRLFQLLPQSGRYVVGFGKAYELRATSLSSISHHLQGPTGPKKN
ncbi:MAG: heme utilization protein HutZ [Gammaproteobacteria bacterium]|nr:heme utilization protein HutZ [Gammaproteobacteria bacterium]